VKGPHSGDNSRQRAKMSFCYSCLGESFSFGRKTPHLGEDNRYPDALTHAKPKTKAKTKYNSIQPSIQ